MADVIHTLRHDAMATFFEVRIAAADAAYARQSAQAAFAAVDRAEARLSRFLDESEISRINGLKPGEVIPVSADVFDCLAQALDLQQLTRGAFDPALGGRALAERGQLLMDRESLLVGVEGAGVSLDLGAIGKGFALDLAAGELRAWDMTRALLIGGGSSILALDGPDPGSEMGWEIGIGGEHPSHRLFLANNALGSSGTAVKGEHIIDPRTGSPARSGRRTWAIAGSAAEADALSTAWMVLSLGEIAAICAARPGAGAIVQTGEIETELWSASLDPRLHFRRST